MPTPLGTPSASCPRPSSSARICRVEGGYARPDSPRLGHPPMPMSVRLDVAHERILGTPQRLEAS
jgi:hypothetical protein